MIGTEQAPAAPPQPGRMSDVPYAAHRTGENTDTAHGTQPGESPPGTVRRNLEAVLATEAPPQRSLIAAPTARSPAKVRPETGRRSRERPRNRRTNIRRHRPGATFHRKLNAVKHL